MIRIFDRQPPRGLVDQRPARTPFAYLLRLVVELRPELLDRDWTILDETIVGWGLHVVAIDERLATEGPITIAGRELLPILMEGWEYFDHVTLIQPDTGIVLKDFDGTYLVVDGDVELETYVSSCYADSDISG